MSERISFENQGGYLWGLLCDGKVGICLDIYVEKTSLIVDAFSSTDVLCRRDGKSKEQKSP